MWLILYSFHVAVQNFFNFDYNKLLVKIKQQQFFQKSTRKYMYNN